MSDQVQGSTVPASRWRLQLGGGMFALSIVLPAVGLTIAQEPSMTALHRPP